MKSYSNSNEFDSIVSHNGKGRLSSWAAVPDEDFLAKVLKDKVPKAQIEEYLAALKQFTRECPNGPDSEYFQAVDHIGRLELYLDNSIDFDEPIAAAVESPAQRERKASISQEQLMAEIDQLVDQNVSEAKLQELLPFIAKLAGLQTRDVQGIYLAKLAELETSQSPAELRKDLDELLAIGGESLNLYEYLPQALADPLLRLAGRMAIRPEVFLLTLLVAISSLHKVGTHLVISAEDKFLVPPNLFAGLVAESGQKKSPVLRILIKHPLDTLERQANEPLKLTYDQALEEWQDCPKEDRKEQFPDGEPKSPAFVDYYFTEGTVEGINRQFDRFPERGMLYLRDELAGVFAFDKYRSGKGTERQDFLSFYDGFGKKELRADGFASRAKQVLLSIFGTIQPEILKQLMEDPLAADGQWSRFLFVIQPLQPAILQGSSSYDINSELINPLYKRVDELPLMSYKLSPEAFESYERAYNQLEIKRTTHSDPAMRAVFSKMEGTIGRLALNLHVIHQLIPTSNMPVAEHIPKIRITQACKLAKFFINQIKLINAAVRVSDEGEITPHLAAIVERSRSIGAVDARGIRRSINAFRNASVQEIRGYFRQLAELGYGECQGGGARLQFKAFSSVQSTSEKS